MGLPAKFTEYHSTSQQSVVTARPRRGCVLHHGATTSGQQIINMMVIPTKQVSAQAVVDDGRRAKVVDAWARAWSLSDAYWDSVLSSVECANETIAGWTISAESHESLAILVAHWATEGGWTPHRDGDPRNWTVFGHREIYTIFGGSYPTACPGGMNLDWIAVRARQLMAGDTPEPPKKEVGKNMAQRAYYARVDAAGADNGEWMLAGVDIGPLNEKGTVEERKQDGYRITTDKEEAKVWARQYSVNPEVTAATHLTRDLYIKQQEFARKDAQEYRAFMRSLFTG